MRESDDGDLAGKIEQLSLSAPCLATDFDANLR